MVEFEDVRGGVEPFERDLDGDVEVVEGRRGREGERSVDFVAEGRAGFVVVDDEETAERGWKRRRRREARWSARKDEARREEGKEGEVELTSFHL